jgi:hypothetical protein
VNQQEQEEEEQACTSGLFFFFFFFFFFVFCQANTVHGPFFKPLQLPLSASYLMLLPEPHFSAISALSLSLPMLQHQTRIPQKKHDFDENPKEGKKERKREIEWQ